jgi:oligopeptide/dipeptide ABC transporter ATP-binding protein
MVMYGGLVMESGCTDAIISNPAHPYTRALLASAPRFGAHWSDGPLASIPGKVPDPGEVGAGCPFAPRCPLAIDRCRAEVPPIEPLSVSLSGAGDGAEEEVARTVRCFRAGEATR